MYRRVSKRARARLREIEAESAFKEILLALFKSGVLYYRMTPHDEEEARQWRALIQS